MFTRFGFVVVAFATALGCSSGMPCGPSTCTTCCTPAGQCVLQIGASFCGNSGAACTTCSGAQTCSAAGVCTGAGAGGGASGSGTGGGSVATGAVINGPLAFQVRNVIPVSGGVVISSDPICGSPTGDFEMLEFVTQSGSGPVGRHDVVTEINVAYRSKVSGQETRVRPTSGYYTFETSDPTYKSGTVSGVFDLQFPNRTGRTTGSYTVVLPGCR